MSVQAVEAFSPYSTITASWQAGLPTWMNAYDAQRILSYQIYEQIYWNVPDTFKVMARGSDTAPIYVPTGRVIVDTTDRYIGSSPALIIDPDMGTPDEQAQAKRMFNMLFRRERFWAKYHSNKLYGIMRGDWLWHIMANPAKPLGSRIKIEAIDPAAYFPVTHPDDPDKIIAVHIVEQVQNEKGDTFIKRQTYKRGADPINNNGSDTTIYNEVALFRVDKWEALDDNPVQVIKPATPLPPQITAIPIYKSPNVETPGDPYGSSELRGYERIMAAVNQAVSDEELALALEGLGLYETDGGPPRDEKGNVTDWILGPGQVVEHALGSKFQRVNGITSVDPVQNHLAFLINSLKEASGLSDAATGKVDVQVAESGVALMMQLSPLLAKREVRNDTIADTHNQMFWDLRAWFAAYEQFETVCIPEIVFGSPIPENREKGIKEILDIVAAGIADAAWAHEQLNQYGFSFPDDLVGRMIKEAEARARASDPFAARMAAEDDEVQP